MAENPRKEVVLSKEFEHDLVHIFEYGESTFGHTAAKAFIAEIYGSVWNLDGMCLLYPECRHLSTKSQMYRNIILGSYLIIYRITTERIEVLRAINGKMSIHKLRESRKIKP